MPLLREGHLVDNDPWTLFDDQQVLPADASHAIVSVQRFLSLEDRAETIPAGVSIAPADNVTLLAQHISKLGLICIEIPVYTDGRGYSHARLLRSRLGYTGELRAVGDVRADQILFMQRLGINTFDCIEQPDQALVKELIHRFKHNYQPSYALPTTN